MFRFILGVIVGAVGFWAYRFWKGDEDKDWEQSFSSNNYSYGSQPSSTAGTGVGSTGSSMGTGSGMGSGTGSSMGSSGGTTPTS